MNLFAKIKSLAAPPSPKRLNGAISRPALIASAVALAMLLGGGAAYAAKGAPGGGGGGGGGGTAKPPVKGAVAPFATPTLPDPVFTDATAIHGFDITGFIQDMTVDSPAETCPGATVPAEHSGGKIMVNGTTITVPCNMIIQMPANTLSWRNFVNGGALGLNSTRPAYPSFEIHVVGNTVNGKQIAGLIDVSQQTTQKGSGYISRIDLDTGNIEVTSTNSPQPTILQINDPSGRFGRVRTADPRFSVDDANPTIHAATGFPMCVPRGADDAACPQKNRPLAKTPTTTNNCRNFSQAAISPLPASGELSPPALGQVYCSQFVMKAVGDATRLPTDPDPRQQAPFEVGDFINYSGTLFKSPTSANPDFISAHTIEANVGIYTQPGTQPSYLSIGDFGIGSADPNPIAVSGVAQETQDRLFLETSTTDILTPVDIYLIDVDNNGVEHNRWVTPYEMTGECNPALTLAATCRGVSGGITTQNTGAQPQRARLRASKAPTGLLSQPTRTLRVMARSMCVPDPNNLSQALVDNCLASQSPVANGLIAGQYVAPVFEFIFPENVKPGDPIVPNDFWHLPFIRNGEGSAIPAGSGPLAPTPW